MGIARVTLVLAWSFVLVFAGVGPAPAAPFVEWDCGLAFIGCGQNVAIDTSQNPTTYIAAGISIEVANPEQPNAKNQFSFAFMVGVGNFGNVIDVPINQNIQTTKISDIETFNDMTGLFPGDKVLSFDTFYGPNALPQAYKTFLGSNSGEGFVFVTFKPNPVAEGSLDHVIDAVHIVINPVVPWPGSGVLVAIGLLVVVGWGAVRGSGNALVLDRYARARRSRTQELRPADF